jgi:ligand-binding sensor domain-containing protein
VLRIVGLMAWIFATPAFALSPHKAITQFVHTAWTDKEGAPGNVQALAQTIDGYLWLGTASGLFRFDGVRFTRFEPLPGEDFPDTSIRVLLASHDGALWIVSQSTRVFRLFHGHLTSYSEGEGLPLTRGLTEGPDGVLIAATDKGLRQFKDGIWTDVGKEWRLPANGTRQAYFDKSETLWVVTENGIFCRLRGQDRFVDPGEPISKNPSVYQFAQGPDLALWLAESGRSAHTLRPPGSDAGLKNRYRFTEVHLGASNVLFDRDGSLWVGSIGDGLRRIAVPDKIRGLSIGQFDPEAEQFTRKDGLSADWIA